MSYTKEKWVARIDEYGVDVVVEKTGFGICDIGTRKSLKDANYPNEEADANAHLISAAPNLLEALEVCWASLQTYGEHPIIKIQVEAALKKAVAV